MQVKGAFVPSVFRTSLQQTTAWSSQADGAAHYYHLSGNNCKDPGGSLTATSPPGFQYLAALYDRYRVIGSKCHVEFSCGTDTKDTSSSAFNCYGTLLPCNSNTAWGSYSDAASQPYAKSEIFTTQTPKRLASGMSSALILGQKDVLGPDRLQSFVSTGPSDEWFWSIVVQSVINMATANDIHLSATVTYDIEFFDRTGTLSPAVTELLSQIYKIRCTELELAAQAKKERKGLHWETDQDKATAEVSRAEVLESKSQLTKPPIVGWTKVKSLSHK